jgi:hypothetical protein
MTQLFCRVQVLLRKTVQFTVLTFYVQIIESIEFIYENSESKSVSTIILRTILFFFSSWAFFCAFSTFIFYLRFSEKCFCSVFIIYINTEKAY